jgi:hypothetical protein
MERGPGRAARLAVVLLLLAAGQRPALAKPAADALRFNITMPKDAPTNNEEDAYVCTTLPLPAQPMKLVGVEPLAKQEVVHHILLFGARHGGGGEGRGSRVAARARRGREGAERRGGGAGYAGGGGGAACANRARRAVPPTPCKAGRVRLPGGRAPTPRRRSPRPPCRLRRAPGRAQQGQPPAGVGLQGRAHLR